MYCFDRYAFFSRQKENTECNDTGDELAMPFTFHLRESKSREKFVSLCHNTDASEQQTNLAGFDFFCFLLFSFFFYLESCISSMKLQQKVMTEMQASINLTCDQSFGRNHIL